MNRTILTVVGALSASSLLLVDSAVKGTVLLVLAAVAALMLRRDSAATRHLVWLLAMVAILVMPVLSVMLPQWRVLPAWASSPRTAVADVSPPSIALPAGGVMESPQLAKPADVRRPSATDFQPAAVPSDSQPARVRPDAVPTPVVRSGNWIKALPLVWAVVFAMLMLRLSAARWMLWNSERRAAVICGRVAPQLDAESRSDSATLPAIHDPIVMAMEAICSQLGISRPVTLLIHPARTIPVVWGIFRCRLLLPAAARGWSDEQLRSVLLHELAHIKRGDAMGQLLTQIACALHWFNPLVWFAAWRIEVERERACDDLVLASGVRPSAYAAHLLDIVTGCSSTRWTQACGLAMARTSSLEGRLVAVLGKNLNRRGVSVALAGTALAIVVGIAVPIAMLRAAPDNPSVPSAASESYDWGAPVNGLRAAVVIRSAKPGAAHGIFLAVQNVSDAPLRLSDSMAAKEQRKLYLSDSAGILMALTSGEPTKTDAVLPPRGIVFLPMFPADKEKEGEAALIEVLRKDSLQTWRAVLEINNAPDGAWKGKLTTGETRCTATEGPQPKSEEGRALFKLWQDSARRNGDIPGGLLARLHDKVKEFIRGNTGDAAGDPYAKKMAPLEPRFGVAGDWKPADAVALLDDIAAVHTSLLATTLDHLTERTLQHGQPLPAALEKADWGKPLDGGLRMAHVLEPRAAEYALGTEVKARILLHNSGKEHVAFITSSFEQPGHKAKLADGSELKLNATEWLTRGRSQAYRLAPGEFIEVNTPGLGIGAHDKDQDKHRAEWSDVRAGSWILCRDGDEVTLLPGGIMLSGDDSKADGEPRPWWPDFIAERLSREAPVPLDTTEREHLLYRVVRDLFGTAPSTTEGDAFAADKSPDALKNLAALLAKHPYGKQSEGMIQPGETKFRVLPPDPAAAKKPRLVMNSGRYTLGNGVNLFVTRRGQGARLINEGRVSHYPPGKDHVAHDLKLPDGHDTWAAAWEPGSTVFWLAQKGLLRSFNFTEPAAVKETRYEGDQTAAAPIPAALRALIGTALTAPDAPKQIQKAQPPASTAPASESPKPKHKDARALYDKWQRLARANGDIPGALVGELAAAVRQFIKYNPTWETVPTLNAILPRLDASRDWKAADATALLDEVAEVKDSPLSMVSWRQRPIRKGEALPEKFADTAWKGGPDGLRVAWVLEPGGAEHRIGAALKARLLVWNPGAVSVVLQVPTFHQGGVTASDAKGAVVEVSGISWTTLSEAAPVRLGPGEYIEINTPGVGFGPRAGMGPWAGPRVGSNVLAKDRDDITLTHSPVPLDGSDVGIREDAPHVVGAGWWLAHIKTRLARQLPLPADAAERTRLLDSAVRELFAVAPTAEETAAFVADQTPGALDALAKRLAARADAVEFSGTLQTAPVKFRVLAADANADKQPRVVLGPGEYPLPSASARRGDATLKIVGRPVGDRRTNDAQLIFEATEFTGLLPPDPHKLEVPDGWGTWAIVCRPDSDFFYLLSKGTVRKIDYSKPREVTDTPATDLPAEFRDEVKRQLESAGASAESQAEVFEKPAPAAATEGDTQPKHGAQLEPETEQKLKWGEPVNGLRAALVMHPVPDEPDAADKNDIFLVVQNVTQAAIWLHASDAVPNPRRLIWRDKGVLETLNETARPIPADFQLQPKEVAFFRMCLPPGSRNPGGRSEGSLIAESIKGDTDFSLEGTMEITMAPAGAWSGKLLSGRIEGGTAIPVVVPADGQPPVAGVEKPAAKPLGANMVKVPDDQYVKSGLPVAEVKDVVWNETQNDLSLGYRITGDEWRILGKEVKVELWVRNPGDKDVKFQLNMRPDIGLRMKLKDKTGVMGAKDVAPRRTLGVLDAFYAQLVDVLGFQKWTVVDKSPGLPEISGQDVVSAQPMTAAGVPVKAATVLPRSKDKRWKVEFVDGKSPASVSQELGMSDGAVRVAKCRVLARLKEVVRELESES